MGSRQVEGVVAWEQEMKSKVEVYNISALIPVELGMR